MSDEEWKGCQAATRLYSRVRGEKQKVVLAQYERLSPFLDERGRRLRATFMSSEPSPLIPAW
jgi:hypothetical protein